MNLPASFFRLIGTYDLLRQATVVVLAGLVLWLVVAMVRKPPASAALRLYGPATLWIGLPAVFGWGIISVAPYSVAIIGMGLWLYTVVYAALLTGNRLQSLFVGGHHNVTPNSLSLRLPALLATPLVGLLLDIYINYGLGVPPGKWPAMTFYALVTCIVVAVGYALRTDHILRASAALAIVRSTFHLIDPQNSVSTAPKTTTANTPRDVAKQSQPSAPRTPVRGELPSVSEILVFLAIRILAIIAAKLYTPPLLGFVRGQGYNQSQITTLFVSVALALLLIWTLIFFISRLILLNIKLPRYPEVFAYLVSNLWPFAISLSGQFSTIFLWARNTGISVGQFNIVYPTVIVIIEMLIFFGLRQLIDGSAIALPGTAASNTESATAPPRRAVDYDIGKWAALVKYDEDVAAAESTVRPLGQEWIDELARSYLALGDKTYLKKIVEKIQKTAASGPDSKETQSRTSFTEPQVAPKVVSDGERPIVANVNVSDNSPQAQPGVGAGTAERATHQTRGAIAKTTGSSTAALIFGILGGLFGLLIGLFGYAVGGIVGAAGQSGAGLFQLFSIAIPIASLVGGGMAKSNAVVGGALMLLSVAGMLLVFGFNFFTAIPVVLSGVGGMMALLSANDAKTSTA